MFVDEYGGYFSSTGEEEKAIDFFGLNAENYPRSPHAFARLGDAYRETGKRSLAIRNYETALELDGENEMAFEGLQEVQSR